MVQEHKLKHLEFIQLTIIRMAANSFIIKGWLVTLVAALTVIAQKDTNQLFVIMAYLPIPIFWVLDAYYLSQEKLFRGLYDIVRTTPEDMIDFSMNTGVVDLSCSWWKAFTSRTLIIFYICLLLTLSAVIYILKF